jgi:hypothetical protein
MVLCGGIFNFLHNLLSVSHEHLSEIQQQNKFLNPDWYSELISKKDKRKQTNLIVDETQSTKLRILDPSIIGEK